MGTAPLNRDLQIELMKTSKERQAALIAKWKASGPIMKMIRRGPEDRCPEGISSHRSMKIRKLA